MVQKREEGYSLLLLAGGKSRRMGKDKAQLPLNGKIFLRHLIDKAEELGISQKFLSGHSCEDDGVYVVEDIYPDRGPLGGFHACMKAMKTPYCLVLPVDVPQIPREVLETLLRTHEEQCLQGEGEKPLLLVHGHREEPLIGIYPTKMADTIELLIRDKGCRVFKLLNQWGYHTLRGSMEEWQADNINTPEEYQRLLRYEDMRKEEG